MPASWTAADITVKAKAATAAPVVWSMTTRARRSPSRPMPAATSASTSACSRGCGYLAFAADGQAAARELVLVFRDEDELLGQGN